MTKAPRGLGWYVHRVLCWVGIHAAEDLWGEADGADLGSDWVLVGSYCQVCHKDWGIKK